MRPMSFRIPHSTFRIYSFNILSPAFRIPHSAFRIRLALLALAACCLCSHLVPAAGIPRNLPWSERMALSEMKRHPEAWSIDFQAKPKWGYVNGLVLTAIEKLHQKTKNDRYFQYIRQYGDLMIAPDGTIREYKLEDYSLDNINAGKILFGLSKATGEEKYRKALATLRDQLRTHPRVGEGGFWHKKVYPDQMWLDGLYMAAPFYARYAATFNEPAAFDDIARQFIIMEKHARDPKTGLLYHGWDASRQMYWADKTTGLSPNFWGRAMGWYAMALVDVLDDFPKDHPQRAELIAILQREAQAIAAVQAPSGVWYQVLDQGSRPGNYLESTCSAMFVDALLKGVRQGYLDPSYLKVAAKAWRGILKEFITVDPDSGEVHIQKCCAVAGLGGKDRRDGSFDYYIREKVRADDGKATGPFILAALEVENLGQWLPKDAAVTLKDFEHPPPAQGK